MIALLPLAGALFVTGCGYAPIAAPLRHEARPGITVAAVRQNPAAFRGAVVVWGGRIIKTAASSTGFDLYVQRLPLGGDERPQGMAHASGHFIVHWASALDLQRYRPGRRVTVAGTIVGVRQDHPLLDAEQLVLWRRPPLRNYGGVYPGWPYFWGDEWDDPGPDWDEWGDDHGEGWADDVGEGEEGEVETAREHGGR